METAGKRVSWVELYFDLVFVFAVGQLTHIMVDEPRWAGLGRALGLFMPLWWAWIGFVILYNRHGEDRPVQRLFVLAGTIPCAIAAVETHSAAEGHPTAFTLAAAAVRFLLALAFLLTSDRARWVAFGYGISTVLFAASVLVPGPWRYALWVVALLQEGSHLLLRDAGDARRRAGERSDARRRDGERPPRRSRLDGFRSMLKPPADPARRVDVAHLAERFGLMMIVLLGEVVVAVAASAAEAEDRDAHYWLGLIAGLVLAAALWWIYFTASAPVSEAVLRASGGNPAMAHGLYAIGHLSAAFSLLTMAAGVSLALPGEAPSGAVWLVTGGLAGYLGGTRSLVVGDDHVRFGPWLRTVVSAGTVCLAFLEPVISASGVVLVVTVWAAVLAAYVSARTPKRLEDIAADPLAYFNSPAT